MVSPGFQRAAAKPITAMTRNRNVNIASSIVWSAMRRHRFRVLRYTVAVASALRGTNASWIQ